MKTRIIVAGIIHDGNRLALGKKDKGSKSSDSVESTTKVVETPNEE
jgi:hypothetical protein